MDEKKDNVVPFLSKIKIPKDIPERKPHDELTFESTAWIQKIHPEKFTALIEIMRSLGSVNVETYKVESQQISEWGDQQIVDYINDTDIAFLRRKPTFCVALYGKLRKLKDIE
ncbi:MAG: hypothetical protein Q8Q10_00415 [bacterium]|nr:hypothetical protein [bacterium]